MAIRERQPSNGQSRDGETIALAEAFAVAALGPRRSRWDRLKTAVEMGTLVKAALTLVGGTLVGLVVVLVLVGWRARGAADEIARKADVAAVVERHASQPAHGVGGLERRMDVLETKVDLLLTHFGIAPPSAER